VWEHLAAVLDPTPAELAELEAQINRTQAAQLPSAVRRRRVEVAADLTEVPYHGAPLISETEVHRSQARAARDAFSRLSRLYPFAIFEIRTAGRVCS
jgi:hypothetical protein